MFSSLVPRSTLGICAGIGSIIFIGYCIYFDRKRHTDPNFRKKLREKRKARRLAKSSGSKLPDLRDQDAVQKFFLSEVQLGEDLLSQGDVDSAVEHLGSAIAVCGHPQQLLQILQQTLPPQVFHILLQRLPIIGQSVHARQLANYGPGSAPSRVVDITDEESSSTVGGSSANVRPIAASGDSMERSFISVEDELE